jgi:hypothetical protein
MTDNQSSAPVFRVGQKVERIPAPRVRGAISHEDAARHGAKLARVGEVYTVRLVRVEPDGSQVLLLVELDNSHMANIGFGPLEPGFLSYGFRPLVERKTDISIFTAMLDTAKDRVSA